MSKIYLNRYQTERKIAEGGLCTIELGRQLDQNRPVVIKRVKDVVPNRDKALQHFRREIHIHSRFQHKYAARFYDGDAESESPVLVMEHLRGMDLADLLLKERRLSLARTGRIVGQLCQVLHSVHQAGIVHRDLKPGNVMILFPQTKIERVKLMDFGLAKMPSLFYLEPLELASLQNPTAAGTPEYVSPEQIQGLETDHKTDIYSLGILLFEMLSGKQPFVADTVEGLLEAHLEQPPPTFADVGFPDLVPPEIEILIHECLAKHPGDRPDSVEVVAFLLEHFLGVPIYESDEESGITVQPMSTPVEENRIIPRGAQTYELTTTTVESMLLLKLKGFFRDLGGEIVESQPGKIKVDLGTFTSEDQRRFFRKKKHQLKLEMLMEASGPRELHILAIFTSPTGAVVGSDKKHCDNIYRELQSYLR